MRPNAGHGSRKDSPAGRVAGHVGVRQTTLQEQPSQLTGASSSDGPRHHTPGQKRYWWRMASHRLELLIYAADLSGNMGV
jgi:hypothetical protein